MSAIETPRRWPPFTSDGSKVSGICKSSEVTHSDHTLDTRCIQVDTLDDKAERLHKSLLPMFRHGYRLGHRILHAVLSIMSLLRYLLPRQGRPVRKKAFHELHPLSYLDALRGYLAMIIFTGHTMPTHWKWIPASVLAIPWFHFPFRGGFTSLDIFFWISGYTITYRIIGFAQTKRTDKLLETLASSMFRRYPRLFLPMLPVTFLTVIAVSTGLAIPPENKAKTITGNPIWWWVKDMGHALNPFTNVLGWWDGHTGSALIDPFWSLNAEFRSSMILFGFCTATCKMSTRRRKQLIWLCIPPFMCWQAQWAVMAFLGMWFAECRQGKVREKEAQHSLVRTHDPQTENPSIISPKAATDLFDVSSHEKERKDSRTKLSMLNKMLGSGISSRHGSGASRLRQPFLLALFLYSFVYLYEPYKSNEKKAYPHYFFNHFVTPEHWHPQMKMHLHLIIGAFMMLYPLDQIPQLQRPLLTPFSQFLGELSFGIYIVHFPIRWIVWDARYVKWQSDRYGNDKFDRFWILFPGYAVMAILVLWAADLFRRLDVQVVKFCKNLESWVFE